MPKREKELVRDHGFVMLLVVSRQHKHMRFCCGGASQSECPDAQGAEMMCNRLPVGASAVSAVDHSFKENLHRQRRKQPLANDGANEDNKSISLQVNRRPGGGGHCEKCTPSKKTQQSGHRQTVVAGTPAPITTAANGREGVPWMYLLTGRTLDLCPQERQEAGDKLRVRGPRSPSHQVRVGVCETLANPMGDRKFFCKSVDTALGQ